MNNFDLKKYLAENKLLKEGMSLEFYDGDVELIADSGDYVAEIEDNGKVSFSVVYEEEDDREGMEFDEDNWKDLLGSKHAFVEIASKIPTEVEAIDDYVMITVNLEDLKGIVSLAEGKLLKESAPGYDTRKFGESLPTMESVKAAYEAKNKIKENLSDRAEELEMDFMDPRNKFGDEWQEEVSNVLVRKYDGHWENWENENPDELEMLLTKFKNLLAEDMSYEAKNSIKEDYTTPELEKASDALSDAITVLRKASVARGIYKGNDEWVAFEKSWSTLDSSLQGADTLKD